MVKDQLARETLSSIRTLLDMRDDGRLGRVSRANRVTLDIRPCGIALCVETGSGRGGNVCLWASALSSTGNRPSWPKSQEEIVVGEGKEIKAGCDRELSGPGASVKSIPLLPQVRVGSTNGESEQTA